MDLGYKIKKGVYLISPPKIDDLKCFITDLKFILKKVDIAFFQLRLKDVNKDYLFEVINALKPICIKYNTDFILNDDPIISAQYALDGLHVGALDGNIDDIKRKFNGIIGVSCYNNLERALEMSKHNIQYVSFGAFYPSETKPSAVKCDISILKAFKKKSKLPICVIGGITSSNAEVLIKNGADLVAISNGVWSISTNKDRVLEIQKILSFFS